MILKAHAPEGVSFNLRLAGPVSRLLARLIDVGVLILIYTIDFLVVLPLLGFAGEDLLDAAMYISVFAISFGYNVLTEWLMGGRTVGKLALSLRVLDESGLPLSFPQALIRNLLRVVDMLPVFYLVGGASIFFTRYHQRLGDLAARTVVISQRRPRAPDFKKALRGKYNSMLGQTRLAAKLRQEVSPEEAGLALDSLLRRDDLEDGERVKLYHFLRESFESRVAFPEESTLGISDEQYVRNVVEIMFEKQSG